MQRAIALFEVRAIPYGIAALARTFEPQRMAYERGCIAT